LESELKQKFTPLNDFKSNRMFHYVYVLKSVKDRKFYTGYTKDFKLRFEFHKKDKV